MKELQRRFSLLLEKDKTKQHTSILKFEEKVLKLIFSGDKRKASNLIEKHLSDGNPITSTNLLKFILEPSGMTVAHKMAHLGYSFADVEILKLKGEDRSKANAIYGHNACSVAFILAKKGHSFSDPQILSLGSEDNRSTVAHAMALKGFVFTDKSILKLADEKGTSVAHVMASAGYSFKDPEILGLKNNFGFSVQDFQVEKAKNPSLDV